jgi:hypothetical protein
MNQTAEGKALPKRHSAAKRHRITVEAQCPQRVFIFKIFLCALSASAVNS